MIDREMDYKISRCVCFQTLDLDTASDHFQRELGLKEVNRSEESIELEGAEIRLFIDKGPEMGPILEIIVPELEDAKMDLLGQGWSVVLWEGRGQRCYMRNPSGTLFNLWEDPEAFEEDEG
jgi:hypothetical protein